MKKIISIATIFLCLVLQLTAQIEDNPRYLKVERPNDISKINIEKGIPYFVKTEMDGNILKVVVYKDQEIIATYPADTKISPVYQNNATLAINSTLVDENKNLTLVNAEDSLLVFDSQNLQQFKTGEILVGGISPVAPDGYLRKVVSQEVVNGQLIVHTTPAGLDEAFDKISIDEIVDFSDVVDAQSILENNSQTLKSSSGDDSEYDFGKGSINLSFSKEIDKNLTVSLAFKGNIKLEFKYEKKSSLLPPMARFISYLSLDNATSTTIGGKFNLMDWKVGEFDLPEIKFYVPIGGVPFPIILKNKLLFKIDASVDVGTKVTGGIFGSVQAKAGVEYNNGIVSSISGLEKNFKVDGPYLLEPSFKGGISGKVELQTLPYGMDIVKGYASVSWGPQITIQPDNPQWKITSQWKVKAGFKTKFLGLDGDLSTGYDFPENLIDEGNFVTGLPNIFSYPAVDVTENSAKLMGQVRDDNGSTVTERGFYWGNSLGNMNNKVIVGKGTGEYSQIITDLGNGVTYYYRTYATNAQGTQYGELMNFTCAGLPYDLYPSVNEAWNVTDNSVEVSGNINVSGLRIVTPSEYGFVWTTSYFSPQTDIDTYANKHSITPVEDIPPFGENIQATITELLPNTQYTIIAYVKSGGKTFYGGHKNIKTLASANSAVIFTISDVKNITYTGSYTSADFDVTVNGSANVTDKGVCYDMDTSTPTLDQSKISKGSGAGSFGVTLTNLWECYYCVRPYAIVDGKTYFGETKMFLAIPGSENDNESKLSATLSDNSLLPASGGTRTITITSNTDWTVSSDVTWLTISPVSGSNDGTVTVTAEANTTESQRTATITVNGTGATAQTISVTQEAASSGGGDDEEGVVINGVRWATRNVDAPGTFAKNPENYGGLYGWNSKKLLFLMGYGTDFSHPVGSTWEKANDPSPSGWRVPTRDEFEKLLDSNKVNNEWATLNGVEGRRFTDKATGYSIFMPAAGWKDPYYDVMNFLYRGGNYWINSADETLYLSYLFFSKDDCTMHSMRVWEIYVDTGLSVRPVTE